MYRILIADDEPIECQGLEMMLKNYFEDMEILPSVYNGVDPDQKRDRTKAGYRDRGH